MMKLKKSAVLAACLFLTIPLTGCWTKSAPLPSAAEKFWDSGVESENKKFTAVTGELFRDVYKNDMLSLHFAVKNLEAYGFERPTVDLFAESDVDFEQVLSDLQGIDYDKLSRENRVTYDIITEDLTDALNEDLPPLLSYFDYSSGMQTQLTVIATEYEFFEEQDIVDYLDMIEQIPAYFDYLYEAESARVDAGYGLSDDVLQDVIEQFENVYNEGENSCFISSFNDKVEDFPGITAAQKEEYETRNRDLVLGSLFPAYKSTAEKIALFAGKGLGNAGLCAYEGGKEYYASLLKAKSGYGGTPEELFSELISFYSQQQTKFYMVYSLFRTAYNSWVNGGAQGMTDPEKILEYFSTHLDGYFPAIGNTTYTIKYLSESIAATMPNTLAYYLEPQIDNYANGAITVNGFAVDEEGAMNTLAHEGYPGHLYQHVYFLSKNPDPVRNVFSFQGYTEGWAVYAANQAEYIYKYPKNDSVYSKLNEMNVSMSYALYAIMDIGVNYYGWQADDITQNFGFEKETAEEIRMTVIELPGVYLSYGAGNMQMYALRDYAESREGNRFDIVDFHRFILDMGPCNFDLLQKAEKEYYDLKLSQE